METIPLLDSNKPIRTNEQKAVDIQEQQKEREERNKERFREIVSDKKGERQNRQNELDTITIVLESYKVLTALLKQMTEEQKQLVKRRMEPDTLVLEEMDVICGSLRERYKLLYRELKKENLEIRLLKKYIDECYIKENEKERKRPQSETLAKAVMSLARFRARRSLRSGWLCGTYCSGVRGVIQRECGRMFDETGMERLICYCREEEVNADEFCEDMLLVLQKITPNLQVNARPRRLKDYLD